MIKKLISSLIATSILALSFIPAAEARRVSITKGYSGAPYTYNITSANTASFRAVANAKVRNAILTTMGDSTMRGVNEAAIPYNSQYPNAMPMQLAALLNASGTTAGANNWYGMSGTSLNDYVIRDSRVAVTGGTVLGGSQIQGGSSISFPTTPGTFSFTNQFACNTANIIWRDSSTVARIISWSVDGGAATQIPNSGSAQFGITTIPLGALGLHTILISWVGSTPELYGIDCWDSTRTEIHIEQWGISGGTANNMIANTGTPNAGRIQQFQATGSPNFGGGLVDMVVCECGIVNSWRTSVSVAAVKADLTTLVQAVKATGSNFIFLTPPYDGGSSGFTANQNAYVQAMYQVAAEQNVGLIDIRQKWISYTYSIAQGWQTVGDFVHPSLAGYKDEAQVVFNVIKSILNNTFAGFPQLPFPDNDNNPILYTNRRVA